LWMLQQGGMTNMEALRAATIDGARYLGMDADIGSIEKGKLADLVVLDRNPLENIRHSESISMVVLNGRVLDGKTLNDTAPNGRQRLPFWWERKSN
jgi:imidazolonepropionase-like amidohydrolase